MVLDGILAEEAEQALRHSFGNVDLKVEDRQSTLFVNLPQAKMLYDLMDFLRAQQLAVETINQQEVDLERAFLSLVRKEREKCNGTS